MTQSSPDPPSGHPYMEIDVAATDFRQHPELYRIGRGEQGVRLEHTAGLMGVP